MPRRSGTEHPNAALSPATKAYALELLESGVGIREVARRLEVGPMVISRLASGDAYKDDPEEASASVAPVAPPAPVDDEKARKFAILAQLGAKPGVAQKASEFDIGPSASVPVVRRSRPAPNPPEHIMGDDRVEWHEEQGHVRGKNGWELGTS